MPRIAMILARGGSKGIPGKNLKLVGGVSLVGHAVEAALSAGCIPYVSSDDASILEEGKKYNAFPIRRPDELATDVATSESALIEAIRFLNLNDEPMAFIQPTSPFIAPRELVEAFSLIENNEADVAFAAKPNYSFDWEPGIDSWTPVNHPKTHRPRRQDLGERVSETGAFYVFRAGRFLEEGYRFFGRVRPVLQKATFSVDIDDTNDLELARLLYPMWVIENEPPVDLSKVKVVFYDFDGVQTDNTIILNQFGDESVRVSRADGQGVEIIRSLGVHQFIISTERNKIVSARANKLNIPCFQSVSDKGVEVSRVLRELGLTRENALFLGNDVNDIPGALECGFVACVSDASSEFSSIASIRLESSGGEGAIRELAELIQLSQP